MKTITMSVSRFRPKCLKLMDQVSAKQFIVIITKRRKPIAKMIPLQESEIESATELRGNIQAK